MRPKTHITRISSSRPASGIFCAAQTFLFQNHGIKMEQNTNPLERDLGVKLPPETTQNSGIKMEQNTSPLERDLGVKHPPETTQNPGIKMEHFVPIN